MIYNKGREGGFSPLASIPPHPWLATLFKMGMVDFHNLK